MEGEEKLQVHQTRYTKSKNLNDLGGAKIKPLEGRNAVAAGCRSGHGEKERSSLKKEGHEYVKNQANELKGVDRERTSYLSAGLMLSWLWKSWGRDVIQDVAPLTVGGGVKCAVGERGQDYERKRGGLVTGASQVKGSSALNKSRRERGKRHIL